MIRCTKWLKCSDNSVIPHCFRHSSFTQTLILLAKIWRFKVQIIFPKIWGATLLAMHGCPKKVNHIDVTVLQMPQPCGTFSMILLGKEHLLEKLAGLWPIPNLNASSAYFWMASEGALVASSSYAVHWTLILHYSHALFQLFLSNIPLFTPPL